MIMISSKHKKILTQTDYFLEGSSPRDKVSYSYVSGGEQVLVHEDIRTVPKAIFHDGGWVLLSSECNRTF